MKMISRKTRIEFREYLAGWTLAKIRNLFDGYDVPFKVLPPEEPPQSERRALVDGYYAGLNWMDQKDVNKVVEIYTDILEHMKEELENPFNERGEKQHARLLNLLEKDGFQYDGNQIKRTMYVLAELP